MEINHDELDVVQQMHIKWRVNYPELSEVYVPGEGDSPIAFIIGEAPGAQEEIKRRPFVGPAGQAQRDLMKIAYLTTEDTEVDGGLQGDVPLNANCWLTNVVKFHPPKNATPHPEMIMSVRHILRREWHAVGAPRLIIPVGAVALHAVLGRRVSILRVSGKPQKHYSNTTGLPVWVYPMIHPSYAIRNESIRPLLIRDWEELGEWLSARGS